MFRRLASLTLFGATLGLGLATPLVTAEARDPTEYIECTMRNYDRCERLHPGDYAAIEQCAAERESNCAGLDGDPNNPPPFPGCTRVGPGMWLCP